MDTEMKLDSSLDSLVKHRIGARPYRSGAGGGGRGRGEKRQRNENGEGEYGQAGESASLIWER